MKPNKRLIDFSRFPSDTLVPESIRHYSRNYLWLKCIFYGKDAETLEKLKSIGYIE